MNFYEFDQIISEAARPNAKQMLDAVNKAIDEWEQDTKNDLLNHVKSAPKRGILSRIGGALQNMWYTGRGGRSNEKNPQYYRNQFGDSLGMEEGFDPVLSEIRLLVEETEKMVEEVFFLEFKGMSGSMGRKYQQTQNSQNRMGISGTMGNQAQKTSNAQQQNQNQQAPNLKIFNIISQAAQKLKGKIKNLLMPPTTAPTP